MKEFHVVETREEHNQTSCFSSLILGFIEDSLVLNLFLWFHM